MSALECDLKRLIFNKLCEVMEVHTMTLLKLERRTDD